MRKERILYSEKREQGKKEKSENEASEDSSCGWSEADHTVTVFYSGVH
jgi:ribosomal protein L32